MRITTATVCLKLKNTSNSSFPISTISLGNYEPIESYGAHIVESNYAKQHNNANQRTFYDSVKLKLAAARNITAMVFPTGKIQIAGLGNVEDDISTVKEYITCILLDWRGCVPTHEIHTSELYGFHLHFDIIYGYPWWPGGVHDPSIYDSNHLVPIGINKDGKIFMHGTEMKRCGILFTSLHKRRDMKGRGTLFFDELGRVVYGDYEHPKHAVFTYGYSAVEPNITISDWDVSIVLINGCFRLPIANYNLSDAYRLLRDRQDLIRSYDPNRYKNLNIKFFKDDGTAKGTALISKSGYVQLCGFKSVSDMQCSQQNIIEMFRPFLPDHQRPPPDQQQFHLDQR